MSAPVMRLVRAIGFSSAHRYFNPSLSDEENRKLYGSLYREHGFGHNFRLEAHWEGVPDPLTGMIINLVEIDGWLKDTAAAVDHFHLNEVPAFKGVAPTPERIAKYFFVELERRGKGHASGARLVKVRLYEGDHLWLDCMAE